MGTLVVFSTIAVILTAFGLYCEFKILRSRWIRNQMLHTAAYGDKEGVYRVQLGIGIDLNAQIPIPAGLWGKYRPERFGLFLASLLQVTPPSYQAIDSYENVARFLLIETGKRYQKTLSCWHETPSARKNS